MLRLMFTTLCLCLTLAACSQRDLQIAEAQTYLEKTVPTFLSNWDADTLEKCGVRLTPAERDAFYRKHLKYGNFRSIKECNRVSHKTPVQPIIDFDMEIQFDKRVASAYAALSKHEGNWKLDSFELQNDLSDDIDGFNRKSQPPSQVKNTRP